VRNRMIAKKETMYVKVIIPATLRQFTDGLETVKITANSAIIFNVSSCLDTLKVKYPELGSKLYDKDGNLARFVHVFVNGRKALLDDVLIQGDEVLILIAVAGG